MGSINYKDSGVDIEKGEKFVELIKKKVESTHGTKVIGGIGGFAGLYDQGTDRYLATGTDGVGTKLKIAQNLGIHDTIGIDLVAMCVNDIICCGARPMFFLDYLGCGRLNVETSVSIVEGIVEGCKQSNMALIGGETAEMPGFYSEDEYDLAGFAVGDVHKDKILDGTKIKDGDTLIGIASSGFHSNGYSLIRKLIQKTETEILKKALAPTQIYVKSILDLMDNLPEAIKGIAHITGSGFHNIRRMNPKFDYIIDCLPEDNTLPEIINIIKERSKLSSEELYSTFNMGIGMVIATDNPKEVVAILSKNNQKAQIIGPVCKGDGSIHVKEKNIILKNLV